MVIQSSGDIQVPSYGGADQIVPAISNVPDIQPGHQVVILSGPQYTIPSKISVGVSPVNCPGIVSGGCHECSSPAEVAPDNQTTNLQTLSVSDEQLKIDAINEYIQENDLDWLAGKTSVSNLTDEAFQQMLGAKPPEDGIMSIQSQPLPELSIESLPDNKCVGIRDSGGGMTDAIRF